MSMDKIETPRTSLLAWPSLLSLDAVLVAVAWQQLLMLSFCDRSSTWPEMGALASTVWLIYVADRLLDAMRLDVTRPHALRHRFYFRHNRTFRLLWCLVFVANALLVTSCLPMPLLQNGLLLASAVLVYGAGVHFLPSEHSFPIAQCPSEEPPIKHRRMVTKEVQVGILFAFGVSLTVWTNANWLLDHDLGRMLASSTIALAVLFGGNCILVARFERHLDRAQTFSSICTGRTSLNSKTSRALIMVALLPWFFLLLRLPATVWLPLLASATGLITLSILPVATLADSARGSVQPHFDMRGVWVDAMLWIPPAIMMCLI